MMTLMPSWAEIQGVATQAAHSIPVPPTITRQPAQTPASDALGISQVLAKAGPSPVLTAVRAMPQAFLQAAGAAPAQSQLGALLGAGIGGATMGTGPLPGALGVAAQQLFGQSGVPMPSRFPTVRVILEMHPGFARTLNRSGTSLVTRLWGLRPSVVGDFRQAFMDLAQLRHEDEFRASLLTLLRELTNHIANGLLPGSTPWPAVPSSYVNVPGAASQWAVPASNSAPFGTFTASSPVDPRAGIPGAFSPSMLTHLMPVRPATLDVGQRGGAPIAARPYVPGGTTGAPIVTPVGMAHPSMSLPLFASPSAAPSMATATAMPFNPRAPGYSGGYPGQTSGLESPKRWKA